MYIEFRVIRTNKKKKRLEVQKRPREAIACLWVWVVIEISLFRQSFLALCRDKVLYVATWFLGCRCCRGRDRGFPGCDNVIFLMVFFRDRGPPYFATVFCSLS